METLRIVMASPKDTADERERFDRVVREVDDWIARDLNLRLEPYRWETSAHPGFHVDGPQGVINEMLKIEKCHLLIGAFNKRFGTPGADGKTGTEHEIEAAEQANAASGYPHIKLWFRKSKAGDDLDEVNQYKSLLEFRERRKSQYLMGQYARPEDFERALRRALVDHLRKRFPRQQGRSGTMPPVAGPLVAAWSTRDWDGNELDRALTVYDELAPRALAALENTGARDAEKSNALRLIFAKGKLGDILAAFECEDRWPIALHQLRPEDTAVLLRAARGVEDLLIGVFRLTAATNSRVQDALRCMRPLNSRRIAAEIMRTLTLLRDEPFGMALQVLVDEYGRELEGCSEGLPRLAAAMRGGEYFDQSLKVARLVDGPMATSLLERLVAEFARAAQWDSAMLERLSKLSEVLVALHPPELRGEEIDEGQLETTYPDLDGEQRTAQ